MLGGSLTFGRGASQIGSTDWVPLLRGWLQAAFPGVDHVVHNGAVAASPSEYMAFCMQVRVHAGALGLPRRCGAAEQSRCVCMLLSCRARSQHSCLPSWLSG